MPPIYRNSNSTYIELALSSSFLYIGKMTTLVMLINVINDLFEFYKLVDIITVYLLTLV